MDIAEVLGVPVELQEEDGYCQPCSTKMVLKYWEGEVDQPELLDIGVEELADIYETDTDGTPHGNLVFLKEFFESKGLPLSVHIRDSGDDSPTDIQQLMELLGQGVPPIVWYRLDDYKGSTGDDRVHDPEDDRHASVLTCIDRREGVVEMCDPLLGEISWSLTDFEESWRDVWWITMVIKHIEGQTKISEYTEENEG